MNQSITQKFGTIKETSNLYSSFSESSLRYLIFHAEQNGLGKCLRRVGKKILICLPEFEKWIDEHKVATHEASETPEEERREHL